MKKIVAVILVLTVFLFAGCSYVANDDEYQKMKKRLFETEEIMNSQSEQLTDLEEELKRRNNQLENLEKDRNSLFEQIKELDSVNKKQADRIADLKTILKKDLTEAVSVHSQDNVEIAAFCGMETFNKYLDLNNIKIRFCYGYLSDKTEKERQISAKINLGIGLIDSKGQVIWNDNFVEINEISDFGSSIYEIKQIPQIIDDFNYSEQFVIPKELLINDRGVVKLLLEVFCRDGKSNETGICLYYKISDGKVMFADKPFTDQKGEFFELNDAYEREYVSKNDIKHFRFYESGKVFEGDANDDPENWTEIEFVPQTQRNELTDQIEADIKEAYYYEFKELFDREGYGKSASMNTMTVSFFGEYNGSYIIEAESYLLGYGLAVQPMSVAGIVWNQAKPFLRVFRYY